MSNRSGGDVWVNLVERVARENYRREVSVRAEHVESQTSSAGVVCFRDPTGWQWFTGGVILVSALAAGFLALAGLGAGDAIFASIVGLAAIVGFILTWRYRRMGMLRADDEGITEFRPLRNRTWLWEDIERVTVDVRILPFKLVESRVLVLHGTDGREQPLDTIVAPPKRGKTSWVDVTAREINRRIGHLATGETAD